MVTNNQTNMLLVYYALKAEPGQNSIDKVWRSRFNLVSLLAIKDFFQPDTRVICNKVFLRSPGCTSESEEEFLTKRLSLDYQAPNISEVISSYNWVELDYQLGPTNSAIVDFPDSELEKFEEEAANIIRKSWEVWLQAIYVDRRFIVRTLRPEITGYSWGIGFEEILS